MKIQLQLINFLQCYFFAKIKIHKQLLILIIWVAFVGWAIWGHAQQSQQPPIHDALSYYQKAYNFWNKVQQHKLFNPFNVEPSNRPLGTILMSYPFGFDIDYRGFYFRSVFLPIALLVLAVVIAGYRREMDNKSKWHLVILAAFFSTLSCFYDFELSSDLAAVLYWGFVDNFLASVAALATAATLKSVWTQSSAWLAVGAILSSFCLLVKPAGALVMMLIGIAWFVLAMCKLKAVWQLPDERKNVIRWFLRGMIIFAVFYSSVLTSSLLSNYLSLQNLALGSAGIDIIKSELTLSWSDLPSVLHVGVGYPFVAWLLLMSILASYYLWRTPKEYSRWSPNLLAGLAISYYITLIFGIWFWIFGSGGGVFIRYFIPFPIMAAILALPMYLTLVQTMPKWQLELVSALLIIPIINIALLLPQQNPSIAWQRWTGVNLTSGIYNTVINQAQSFASTVKNEGRNVTLYSMPLGVVDAYFYSVFAHASIAMAPMPRIITYYPIDWRRPSTYRKEEMLHADYWLIEPIRDQLVAKKILANLSVNDLKQETMLFQAWGTQLTTKEGVAVVSETPTARVLRITDSMLLESAFDELIAKHHWRSIFISANPKRQFSEKELEEALALNPPSLENINFGSIFHLRALSVSREEDDVTVRFWWKPLLTLSENDWMFFIHSIDNTGNIVLNNAAMIHFKHPLSSLDGSYLYDRVTFKSPADNGIQRLAVGFYRSNQEIPLADKGLRDWDNRRVIVPLP
jgi:hypothetical protein